MKKDIQVHIQRNVIERGYSLYYLETVGDTDYVLDPLQSVELKKGCIPPPAIQIPDKTAQQLINELWAAGLRPDNEQYSSETIKYLTSHLQDMRTIAFHKLKL